MHHFYDNYQYVRPQDFYPDSGLVIFLSILIFIFGYWISNKVYKNDVMVPLLIASVKSSIFLIYNLFFFDIAFYTKDCFHYMDSAIYFYEKFESAGDLIFTFLRFDMLSAFGFGHFIFNAILTLLFQIFDTISAQLPIAFSIITTFFSGLLLYKLTLLGGLKKRYAKWLYVFFVLQWNVIAYSTFPLYKDSLMLFMSIAAVYLFALWYKGLFKWYYWIPVIYLVYSIAFMRFYLIPLIIVVFLLFYYQKILFSRLTPKKLAILILSPLALVVGMAIILGDRMDYIPALMQFDSNPIFGVIRFFLTPNPIWIQKSVAYVTIPAYLDVIFLPFTLFGMIYCWRSGDTTKIILIYFLVLILFYGVYSPHGEYTSPRHKVQLFFAIVFFQFTGFLKIIFPKVQLFLPKKDRV